MTRSALTVLALCFAIAGCEKAPAGGDVAAGKVIFDENCAACHGPGGNVRQAENYAENTPDLRQVAERAGGRLPRVMLAKIIDGREIVQAHGSRTMPAWGERLGSDDAVVEKKVNDLVAYIESIQQQ